MKMKRNKLPQTPVGKHGFSLMELMIVVAIMGIMMVYAGVYISSSKTKLKTFVYNLRSSFHQAKFEAIKRSRPVYLDFDADGDDCLENGYTIWVDDDKSGVLEFTDDGDGKAEKGEEDWVDADGDGIYDPGEGDRIISIVKFINIESTNKHGPEIYYRTAQACGSPTDQPPPVGNLPAGGKGPDGNDIDQGVEFRDGASFRLLFKPDGLSNNMANAAYFYFPKGPKTAKEVESGPWAISVNGAGRIRVSEWDNVSDEWKDQ